MLRVWGHRGGLGPSGALDGPWWALGVLPGLCRGSEGLGACRGPAGRVGAVLGGLEAVTRAWALPEGTWTVPRVWGRCREEPGALPGI